MAIHPVTLLVLVLSPFLVSCVDEIVYWGDNGHYYQWVPLSSPVTYDQAQTLASQKSHNSKTGYVVTIGTDGEMAFLNSYMSQITSPPLSTGGYAAIWGGAVKSGNSWIWLAAGRVSNPFFDSSTLKCATYCNWNDSSAAAFPAGNNATQIFLNNTNGPTPGTWRSAPSNSMVGALVVEYDQSTSCQAGYTYRTSKGWCEDVNECANNPKLCGSGYQCVNTIGSYHCDDINECANNASICSAGFSCNNTAGGYSCNDIDECAQTPSVCQSGYTCQNSIGSYQCTDINECQANSSLCTKGYSCRNTPGSYSCDDINECQLQATACNFGTRCSNTIGSYTCDSLYYQIQSYYNNLVIDFIVVNGLCRLVTAVPSNSTTQLWSFTPEGFIVNANNGYVVDAEGGLVFAGVYAILYQRKRIEQASNQLWEYDTPTNYWYSASNNNTVLDIYHAQYGPGAPICLFTPKDPSDTPQGNTNQRWALIESAQKPQQA